MNSATRSIKLYFLCALTLIVTVRLCAQQQAIDSLNRVLKEYVQDNPAHSKDSTYVKVLLDLAENYEFVKADSLSYLSEKALKLSTQIGFLNGQRRSLTLIGYYYSDLGMHQKAISNFNKALNYANQQNDTRNKVALLNDLGAEHTYLGDFEKALKSFLNSLDVVQSIKETDKFRVAILYENIAHLYFRQNDLKTALDFYEKVKVINDEIEDETNSAFAKVSHAAILSKLGNHVKAMSFINQSIAVFEKQNATHGLEFAYTEKGTIYLNQNLYKQALVWYEKSQILNEQLQEDRGRMSLFNGMARAYFGMGNYRTATEYAKKAYGIAQKIKSLRGKMSCAQTLFKIYKKNQNYKEALQFHEEYQKISDSLSRDRNKHSLSLLKTQLEHEQQKKDLLLDNEKKLARQRTYVYASLVILGILFATLIPLYINHQKQKKLNIKLANSTSELRKRESELSAINNTKDKLFSIIGHDLKAPMGALQAGLKLLTSGEINKKNFLRYVPKLKAEVDYTLFTLNNLLLWGFDQMNGTKTRPRLTSLSTLIDNNINLLSEVAASKSIKITKQLPENLIGYLDEDQIDLVIRNLISNSIKFTPVNGIITINAEAEDAYWKIMVSDTGMGIDKHQLDKIFSGNTNITTQGTNNEKGTGLGLSLCKEMVLKNKGLIWVESTPKKGSTFFFTVPKEEETYMEAC
ncbi:tetratricopeptide repeat-containing sensor histidine kinase [uncultured Croceitalea sp.]|uniref:tetratricopeptide repeat-containing sensor histidine kinase n=1 Tax=uncultured Croceitalea sp. TaxID=1798908 RepID=UPI003305EFD1